MHVMTKVQDSVSISNVAVCTLLSSWPLFPVLGRWNLQCQGCCNPAKVLVLVLIPQMKSPKKGSGRPFQNR